MKIISVCGEDTLQAEKHGPNVFVELSEKGNLGCNFGDCSTFPKIEFAKLARSILGDVELNDDLIDKLELEMK